MCIPNVYIPSSFEECNTLEMQIAWLGKKYEELDERVTALEEENESEEASEQCQIIDNVGEIWYYQSIDNARCLREQESPLRRRLQRSKVGYLYSSALSFFLKREVIIMRSWSRKSIEEVIIAVYKSMGLM